MSNHSSIGARRPGHYGRDKGPRVYGEGRVCMCGAKLSKYTEGNECSLCEKDPDRVSRLNLDKENEMLGNRWKSRQYPDGCTSCPEGERFKRRHAAKGLCTRCYGKDYAKAREEQLQAAAPAVVDLTNHGTGLRGSDFEGDDHGIVLRTGSRAAPDPIDVAGGAQDVELDGDDCCDSGKGEACSDCPYETTRVAHSIELPEAEDAVTARCVHGTVHDLARHGIPFDRESVAINDVVNALSDLDVRAQARVVAYVMGRFDLVDEFQGLMTAR